MGHTHTPDIIVDPDPHFTINTTTRAIAKAEDNKKVLLIQYDHNSERFSFDIDRMVEGHDVLDCNRIQIHYINIDGSNRSKRNIGLYSIDDLKVHPTNDKLATFTWLISEQATRYNGTLSFLVSFSCTNEDETLYRWNSAIYSLITIAPGIDNNNAVAESYVDELLKWENYIVDNFDALEKELIETTIPAIVDERYIERDFATSEEVASIFSLSTDDVEFIPIDSEATPNTIVQRTDGGQIKVADGVANDDVATVKQLNDSETETDNLIEETRTDLQGKIDSKLDKISTTYSNAERVYSIGKDGTQQIMFASSASGNFSLVERSALGTAQIENPIGAKDIANKQWTEAQIAAACPSVYTYKGSIDTYDNLPTTGNEVGDVWNVEDTGINYAWNGVAWNSLSANVLDSTGDNTIQAMSQKATTDELNKKLDKQPAHTWGNDPIAYGNQRGEVSSFRLSPEPFEYSIIYRNENGTAQVNDPNAAKDIANKQWTETQIASTSTSLEKKLTVETGERKNADKSLSNDILYKNCCFMKNGGGDIDPDYCFENLYDLLSKISGSGTKKIIYIKGSPTLSPKHKPGGVYFADLNVELIGLFGATLNLDLWWNSDTQAPVVFNTLQIKDLNIHAVDGPGLYAGTWEWSNIPIMTHLLAMSNCYLDVGINIMPDDNLPKIDGKTVTVLDFVNVRIDQFRGAASGGKSCLWLGGYSASTAIIANFTSCVFRGRRGIKTFSNSGKPDMYLAMNNVEISATDVSSSDRYGYIIRNSAPAEVVYVTPENKDSVEIYVRDMIAKYGLTDNPLGYTVTVYPAVANKDYRDVKDLNANEIVAKSMYCDSTPGMDNAVIRLADVGYKSVEEMLSTSLTMSDLKNGFYSMLLEVYCTKSGNITHGSYPFSLLVAGGKSQSFDVLIRVPDPLSPSLSGYIRATISLTVSTEVKGTVAVSLTNQMSDVTISSCSLIATRMVKMV